MRPGVTIKIVGHQWLLVLRVFGFRSQRLLEFDSHMIPTYEFKAMESK